MTTNELLVLQNRLEAVVELYREDGISNAELIGVLEIVKINIWSEGTEDG